MPQRNLKEQLVEGASRTFLEKGFNGASVADIVATAGIPKGSVYNHFDSKDDLALEVVRRYTQRNPLPDLVDGEPPALPRLRAYFAALIEDRVDEGVEFGCLLGNFSTELVGHSEPIREYVAQALDEWSAATATVLEQARDAGELREGADPAVLGPQLINAYEGSIARAKVSGDRSQLDGFLTTFDALVGR
jgi:TetR/AcrR family transcriptional regulator, transcriptional repressor for nem operon